jgi:soluble lytic murein transglycosylase-like protein
MIKKILLTVALAAMTITACSPQDTVVRPQTTVTESVLKAQEPLPTWGNEKEKFNPTIIVKPTAPVVVLAAATPKPQPKPEPPAPVKKVNTIEQNLVNHMLSKDVSKDNAEKFASLIMEHTATYDVNPYTILAMMEVETGATYNPKLVGRDNDTGLLQILPPTQRYMKIDGSLFNPSVNIEIGAKYLAYNQKRFGEEKGIVAYNQGEGNVSRGTYNTKYLTRVNKVLATIDR